MLIWNKFSLSNWKLTSPTYLFISWRLFQTDGIWKKSIQKIFRSYPFSGKNRGEGRRWASLRIPLGSASSLSTSSKKPPIFHHIFSRDSTSFNYHYQCCSFWQMSHCHLIEHDRFSYYPFLQSSFIIQSARATVLPSTLLLRISNSNTRTRHKKYIYSRTNSAFII